MLRIDVFFNDFFAEKQFFYITVVNIAGMLIFSVFFAEDIRRKTVEKNGLYAIFLTMCYARVAE